MKVDGILMAPSLAAAGDAAREMEALGYDGLLSAEISHDPFFHLLMAADATEHMQLATGIAVAFARSPMTTANTAWDLQVHSGGRFFLGLGSLPVAEFGEFVSGLSPSVSVRVRRPPAASSDRSGVEGNARTPGTRIAVRAGTSSSAPGRTPRRPCEGRC